MKKYLVESNVDENLYWLVDDTDINRKVCYLSGDENIYGWDGKNMERLSDCIIEEGDYLALFVRVWDEGTVEEYIESWELDVDDMPDDIIVEYDGDYFAKCDSISFCDLWLTLEYGINQEGVLIHSQDYDVYYYVIEVEVERVDYIEQDYPRQPFVNIYEGIDENGKKIRITETHPFYVDQHYPLSELEYC